MATEGKVVPWPQLAAVRAPERKKKIIAVGGGKGGIGKSLISSSLGVAIAGMGHKVVLVDADLGGANLHSCLGIAQPRYTLSDFIDHRVDRLEDALVPTNEEGLFLLSGATDNLDAANPRHTQKSKLLRHLRALDADLVIFDLGAGTSFNVLDFFAVADQGIVVLLPEPTSIENAYRFIKAAFVRRLQAIAPGEGLAELVASSLAPRLGGVRRTPWDVVALLRATHPVAAARLEAAMNGFRPLLLVNQARSRRDFDLGPSVAAAWYKFFGLELGYLGVVGHDDAAWKSVRARQPLLRAFPNSVAADGMRKAAAKLMTFLK